MDRPRLQRLLLSTLVVVLELTSAMPRSAGTTMRLATGDHAHIWFEHGHEHLESQSHAMVHEHVDGLPISVGDSHRHTCLDIGLSSGDWRPSVRVGLGQFYTVLALPSAPLAMADLVSVPTSRVLAASPAVLGIPPPDLLRSTILLI